MAYEAHKWKIGEEITSEKLNHIEKGIEEGGDIQTNITDPQDGQTLKYDAASGKWVNAEGGSSQAPLIVTETINGDTGTLDHTWNEIKAVFDTGTPVFIASNDSDVQGRSLVIRVWVLNERYEVYTAETTSYKADSADGYPVANL